MPNRLFAGVLLLLLSRGVSAEWLFLKQGPEAAMFIEPTSLRILAGTSKVWTLIDFNKPQSRKDGKPFFSFMLQSEWDCKNELTRSMYISQHAGHMGQGNKLSGAATNEEWRPVSPGGPDALFLSLICDPKVRAAAQEGIRLP